MLPFLEGRFSLISFIPFYFSHCFCLFVINIVTLCLWLGASTSTIHSFFQSLMSSDEQTFVVEVYAVYFACAYVFWRSQYFHVLPFDFGQSFNFVTFIFHLHNSFLIFQNNVIYLLCCKSLFCTCYYSQWSKKGLENYFFASFIYIFK